MADKKFYKCSCGVFFATLEAAVAHKCHGASSVQVIKELPRTSQTDRTTCMFQCYTCKTFFENMDTFNSHQCEDEQLEGKPKGTGNESESDAAVWNRNATLLFLDLYKDFQESVSKGRMKKKALWDKISSKMSLHGYNFTADQVGGRWKSLIRGYKNAKDSNKKSGNGAKQYEYEDELDDILGKDPIMKPKFLLGSQPSSPTSNKVPVTSEEPGTSEPKRTKTPTLDVEDSISDDDSSEPTRKKPKRKLTPTNEVVDVFKTYISDQKEEWKRRETMHKERLAVMTSLIDVLKGTIAKPHDPNNNKWQINIKEERRDNNTRRKFRQIARDICREVFDIPEDNRVLFAYINVHNKNTLVGQISFQLANTDLKEPGIAFDSDFYHQVTFLFVKSDFQANGIGKNLLQRAIVIMKAYSDRMIRVQSAESAVGFFEKNGFVVRGEPTESFCGVRLFRYIYNMELVK